MKTIRQSWKLEALSSKLDKYHWIISRLYEMRWTNFGDLSNDRHIVYLIYFSGEEDRQGISFLVHYVMLSAVLDSQPISSRLTTVQLRALPFNVYIIWVYAPTSNRTRRQRG